MQKRSDDRLIAYLDGEVDASERREIEAWLDSDPAARDKLAALAESAALVRSAFDEVMHEPLPDRLIAAARGERASGGTERKNRTLEARAEDRGRPCRAQLVARVAAGRLAVRLAAGRRRCLSECRQAAARGARRQAACGRDGRRRQSLARQRRRLFQAGRQRRRRRPGRCAGHRRRARGMAKDQPELCLRRCGGRSSTSNPGVSISAAPGSSLPMAGRRRS